MCCLFFSGLLPLLNEMNELIHFCLVLRKRSLSLSVSSSGKSMSPRRSCESESMSMQARKKPCILQPRISKGRSSCFVAAEAIFKL